MRKELSILKNATPADVRYMPFPHLILRDCLDADVYAELSRSYPSDETIARLNLWRLPNGLDEENKRTDIIAAKACNHKQEIPKIWLDFISYHVSAEFFAEFMALFGPAIEIHYPWLQNVIRLSNPGVGIRFDPTTDHQPLSLDCQVGINTPSCTRSSVIEAHTDSPVELYAGLLYFKQPEDQAAGGDLELYKWKNSHHAQFFGHFADKSLLHKFGHVTYEANTMVLFLNTIQSVHGVTPRDPSVLSRRLVNIIGEVYNSVPYGLYRRATKDDRVIRRVKNKLQALFH
jgi:hypothetical protein